MKSEFYEVMSTLKAIGLSNDQALETWRFASSERPVYCNVIYPCDCEKENSITS